MDGEKSEDEKLEIFYYHLKDLKNSIEGAHSMNTNGQWDNDIAGWQLENDKLWKDFESRYHEQWKWQEWEQKRQELEQKRRP